MKNNKGITLTSLIIYIAVIFVVIAALMRITTYFSSNMQDAADVSFETEFNKLNLYLLDEAKTVGNGIGGILEDGTQITFTNGNTYSYNAEDKVVYLNGTIKICENIENCVFEKQVADNGKDVLILTIKINGIEKNVEYVLISKDDSLYLLPKGYQEVEYIQSTGTQYIDTGVNGGEKMAFQIKLNTLGSKFVAYEQYFAGDKSSIGVKMYESSGNVSFQNGSTNTNLYALSDNDNHIVEFTNEGSAIVDNKIVGQNISNKRMGNTYVLCIQFSW